MGAFDAQTDLAKALGASTKRKGGQRRMSQADFRRAGVGEVKSAELTELPEITQRALAGEFGAAKAKRAFTSLMKGSFDADTKARIKDFYENGGQSPKDPSWIGKVLSSPALTPIKTALMLIDKPKRAVQATLEEGIEQVGGYEDGKTWGDNVLREADYGWGDVMQRLKDAQVEQAIAEGNDPNAPGWSENKWAMRGLGFLGDVILDPTTYVGAGVVAKGVEGAQGGAKLASKSVARRLAEAGEEEAAKTVLQRGTAAVPAEVLEKVGVQGGVRFAGRQVIDHDLYRQLMRPQGALKASLGDSKVMRGVQGAVGADELSALRIAMRDRGASGRQVADALGQIDAKRAARLAEKRFGGKFGRRLNKLLTEATAAGADGQTIRGAVTGDMEALARLEATAGPAMADGFREFLRDARVEANKLGVKDWIADAGEDYMPRYLTDEAATFTKGKHSTKGVEREARAGERSFEKRAFREGDQFGDEVLGSPELHARFSEGMTPGSRAAIEAQMEGLMREWGFSGKLFTDNAIEDLPRYVKGLARRVGEQAEVSELVRRGVIRDMPLAEGNAIPVPGLKGAEKKAAQAARVAEKQQADLADLEARILASGGDVTELGRQMEAVPGSTEAVTRYMEGLVAPQVPTAGLEGMEGTLAERLRQLTSTKALPEEQAAAGIERKLGAAQRVLDKFTEGEGARMADLAAAEVEDEVVADALAAMQGVTPDQLEGLARQLTEREANDRLAELYAKEAATVDPQDAERMAELRDVLNDHSQLKLDREALVKELTSKRGREAMRREAREAAATAAEQRNAVLHAMDAEVLTLPSAEQAADVLGQWSKGDVPELKRLMDKGVIQIDDGSGRRLLNEAEQRGVLETLTEGTFRTTKTKAYGWPSTAVRSNYDDIGDSFLRAAGRADAATDANEVVGAVREFLQTHIEADHLNQYAKRGPRGVNMEIVDGAVEEIGGIRGLGIVPSALQDSGADKATIAATAQEAADRAMEVQAQQMRLPDEGTLAAMRRELEVLSAGGGDLADVARQAEISALEKRLRDGGADPTHLKRVVAERDAQLKALGTRQAKARKSLVQARGALEGGPKVAKAREVMRELRPQFDTAKEAALLARGEHERTLAEVTERLAEVRDQLKIARATNQERAATLAEIETIRSNQVKLVERLGREQEKAARNVLALEVQYRELEAQALEQGRKAVELEEGVRYLKSKEGERAMVRTLTDGFKSMDEWGLKDMELADWQFDAIGRATDVAKEPGRFLRSVDKVNQLFKTYAILTPGFHIRNTIGALFNNFVAGVDTASYSTVIRNLGKFRRNGIEGVEESVRPFFRELEASGGILWDDAQVASELGQYGNRSERTIKALGDRVPVVGVIDNPVTRASKAVGERVETLHRTVLAYDVMSKGGTLDEALDKVAQFHFDYSDLSSVETGVMKRIVPFWTWTSRNMPLQLEMILREPKMYQRFGAVQRALNDDDDPELVPSWIKDGATSTHLGGGHYWTLDLPYQDVDEQTQGLVREGPLSLLQSAAPIIKTPLELKFGKQAWNGAPITGDRSAMPRTWELVPGLVPALRGLGVVSEKDPDGNWLISNRAAYTVEQAMPLLGRSRRLAPSEKKYQDRQLASILSFFGLGFRTVTDGDKRNETFRRADTLEELIARSKETGKIKVRKQT